MMFVTRFPLCLFLIASFVIGTETVSAAPELPRVFLDTTYSQPANNIIDVMQGGDLQAAIDAAQLGDTIRLQPGAVFTGNFLLPPKSGSGWIYIQSGGIGNLPPPGTRVSPSDAPAMPKLVSPNTDSPIATDGNAHHYRLVGLEVTSTHSSGTQYNLVRIENGSVNTLADFPHDIVVDRCYIHGPTTKDVRRGVAVNGGRIAVIDSYISDIHEDGADSQAIGGWTGPGPLKVYNNFLSGAGENFMLGGADAQLPGVFQEDIEFRKNHVFKPLSWKNGSPDWSIKNLFELKVGRRVLVEGNVFENNWADSQNGFGILLTVRNQDGGSPQSQVADVLFRYNIIKNSESGLNMHGMDDNPSQPTRRILFQHNLWTGIQDRGFQFITGGGPGGEVGREIVIDHNTLIGTASQSSFGSTGDSTNHHFADWAFRNTVVTGGEYGFFGSGYGEGTDPFNAYLGNWAFERNVVIGRNASDYPANNYFPASSAAVPFVDAGGGNYRLHPSSGYRNLATDGTDPGVDFDALEAATAGVVNGNPNDDPLPDPSPGPDDNAKPRLSNLEVKSIGRTAVTISWRTNEPATSRVTYFRGSGEQKVVQNGSFVRRHRVRIRGLKSGKRYSFRVYSEDPSGNGKSSSQRRFKTK